MHPFWEWEVVCSNRTILILTYNKIMDFLHFISCELLATFGVLVCFSSNPIESVLFLIFCFFQSAIILFLFNVEFLGLIFIIIYVGAIAVLFLFVIMMLNIKDQKKEKFFDLFLIYLLLFSFYILSSSAEFSLIETNTFNVPNLLLLVDALNNIGVMGQVLFNFFFAIVLLEGIILFVALFGSIVLTLKESVAKELVNRQLARGANFIRYS